MTSHVELGGVSPSFLLILVKMDGGALSSVSMPLHSLTAQMSLRQLCVAAQTTPEAEERREIA